MTTASHLLDSRLSRGPRPDKRSLAAVKAATTDWLGRSGIDPTNDLSPAQQGALTAHLDHVVAELTRLAPAHARQVTARRRQIVARLKQRADLLTATGSPDMAAAVPVQLDRFLANRVDSRAKGPHPVADVVQQLGDLMTLTVSLDILAGQTAALTTIAAAAAAAISDPHRIQVWRDELGSVDDQNAEDLAAVVLDALCAEFSTTKAATTSRVPAPLCGQLAQADPLPAVLDWLCGEVRRAAFPFGLQQVSSRRALTGIDLVLGGRMKASRPIAAAAAAAAAAQRQDLLEQWQFLIGKLRSPGASAAGPVAAATDAINTWDLIVAAAALHEQPGLATDPDGWNRKIARLLFDSPKLQRIRRMLPLHGSDGPAWWRRGPAGGVGFTSAGRLIVDQLAISGLDPVNQENLLHNISAQQQDGLHRTLLRLERDATPFEFRGMPALNRFAADQIDNRVSTAVHEFRRDRSTLPPYDCPAENPPPAVPLQLSLEDDLDHFLARQPGIDNVQHVVLNLTGVPWALSRIERFQQASTTTGAKDNGILLVSQIFHWWQAEHRTPVRAGSPEQAEPASTADRLTDQQGPMDGDTPFEEIFRQFTQTQQWFDLRGTAVDVRTQQRDRRAWAVLLCRVLSETVT